MRTTTLTMSLVSALVLGACTYAPGMGPGMMNGPAYGPTGAYGPAGPMGPGGMGGMGGPYGPMGPGMMADGMAGGPGWGLGRLDLSGEQRKQLAEIQADIGRRQWALMNAMHAQGGPMHGSPWDESEDRRAYEAMAAVHRQMFELQLEARRRMLAVLTPPQREQLERAGRGR